MSNSSGKWFNKEMKNISQPEPKQDKVAAPQSIPRQDIQPGAPYKKGDVIGQKYEVSEVLGKGGFGIVYLVYSREVGGVFALKTFQDKFLTDQEVRKRFHKEASVWVDLERHPYLVRAYFIDEVSGRLYIEMEYIAPNEEGLNSLEGYLQRRPPDLAQSLRWAIQVCLGMEYAYSKGLRAHRDLKPANIMIAQDKTAKITDFGLAGVISESSAMRTDGLSVQPGKLGISSQTMLGVGFGTPTHMPPEQFDNAAGCDERSDIYSFGVVLYQMAAGGRVPFHIPLDVGWQAMQQLHRDTPVPRLDSPLFSIIQRCLEKSPEKRYQTFKEARKDLDLMLQHQTGEVIIPPQLKELEAWEWNNKGLSLNVLGYHTEALRCLEKALELDPLYENAWINKGNSLDSLGRHEDAIYCLNKAIELDPHDVTAWNNKGASLYSLGLYDDAIRCYDQALQLDPNYAYSFFNKGNSLYFLNRNEEAIHCYDKALELNPHYVDAWNNKGNCLLSLERYEEAICCLDKALKLDPCNSKARHNKSICLSNFGPLKDAMIKGSSFNYIGRYEDAVQCYDKALKLYQGFIDAWIGKGISLYNLSCYEESIQCYDKALELDPSDFYSWNNKGNSLNSLGRYKESILCFDKALKLDPCSEITWNNKGNSLNSLCCYEEALRCLDKALELNPRYDSALNNKGNSLNNLGRYEEALRCYDQALEINPRYPDAWYNKGLIEYKLGHWRQAVHSYQQFLTLAPAKYSQQIEYAHQCLRELEGK